MLYIYQEASFSGLSSLTSKVDKEGELRIFKEKKESRKAESSPAFRKQESSALKVCFIYIKRIRLAVRLLQRPR